MPRKNIMRSWRVQGNDAAGGRSMKRETVAEYLARGGTVVVAKKIQLATDPARPAHARIVAALRASGKFMTPMQISAATMITGVVAGAILRRLARDGVCRACRTQSGRWAYEIVSEGDR